MPVKANMIDTWTAGRSVIYKLQESLDGVGNR